MSCPFEFVPTDRKMKREEYYVMRRLMRYIWREKRKEIEAETQLRVTNFYLYGTTHPECYEPQN